MVVGMFVLYVTCLLFYRSLRMVVCISFFCFFFFKQKTAYEMRISDWSSDVCSSDLRLPRCLGAARRLRWRLSRQCRGMDLQLRFQPAVARDAVPTGAVAADRYRWLRVCR